MIVLRALCTSSSKTRYQGELMPRAPERESNDEVHLALESHLIATERDRAKSSIHLTASAACS